jgi:hypothetical protein
MDDLRNFATAILSAGTYIPHGAEPKGWPEKIVKTKVYYNEEGEWIDNAYNDAIDECLTAHKAIVAEKDKRIAALEEILSRAVVFRDGNGMEYRCDTRVR